MVIVTENKNNFIILFFVYFYIKVMHCYFVDNNFVNESTTPHDCDDKNEFNKMNDDNDDDKKPEWLRKLK